MATRARRFTEGFDARRSADVQAVRRMEFPLPGASPYPAFAPREGPDLGVPPLASREEALRAEFVRLQFPPRMEKLPESIDFRVQNYQVALGAGVGTTAAGPQFQVPQGQVGWLQSNLIYCLAPLATTLFSMAIRINQGPVPGYDNIQNPPGLAQFFLSGDDEMRIPLPNGALVSILFTNIDGAAVTVGGLLQGWYHPLAAELQAWGSER